MRDQFAHNWMVVIINIFIKRNKLNTVEAYSYKTKMVAKCITSHDENWIHSNNNNNLWYLHRNQYWQLTLVFKFQVTVLINILLFIPFTKTVFHLVSMKNINGSSDSNSLETALVLKSGEKVIISGKVIIFSYLSLSLHHNPLTKPKCHHNPNPNPKPNPNLTLT